MAANTKIRWLREIEQKDAAIRAQRQAESRASVLEVKLASQDAELRSLREEVAKLTRLRYALIDERESLVEQINRLKRRAS